MTQRNKKKSFKNEKKKIDNMIRGYQEMAEINLAISKMCFEVEREVEDFYDRRAECE